MRDIEIGWRCPECGTEALVDTTARIPEDNNQILEFKPRPSSVVDFKARASEPNGDRVRLAIDSSLMKAVAASVSRAQEAARRAAAVILPAVKAIQESWVRVQPLIEQLSRDLPAFLERVHLPNWSGVKFPPDDPGEKETLLERILLDEGIALAWVPEAATLQLLLDAPSPQVRRAIIGRRWRSVSSHCETVLDEVTKPELQEARGFAVQASAALRAGHSAASQALSASLIDTVLRAHYDPKTRAALTGFRRSRLDIDDYAFREAIVLGGVFGAHEPFDGNGGERPPHNFSRHASVHAVSRRQYSRVNGVLALMHITALLRLLETAR